MICEETMDIISKKIPMRWSQKDLHFPHKSKSEQQCSHPSLDSNGRYGHHANTGCMNPHLSAEDKQKAMVEGKVCNDEELVKHMSNLPGFLQLAGKEKNIQEKALNFGVLDWKRLEKWKYNERIPEKCLKKASAHNRGNSYAPNGTPKLSPNLKRQPSLHSLKPGSLFPGKHPRQYPSICSHKRNPPCSWIPHLDSSRMETNDACEEEKHFRCVKESGEQATLDTESEASQGSFIAWSQNFHQKVDKSSETNVNNKRNDMKKDFRLEMKSPSLKKSQHKFSLSFNDVINVQVRKSKCSSDVWVDDISKRDPVEMQRVQKYFPKTGCSESSQFTDSTVSLNENLTEVIGNRFSDSFSSQEFEEVPVRFPHLHPPPPVSKGHVLPLVTPHKLVTSQAFDLESCRSEYPKSKYVTPIASNCKHPITREGTMWSSIPIELTKRPETESGKRQAGKGRYQSPLRFSFGLGKMGRSFSIKDSSSESQLSTTYTASRSGPEIEISSDGLNKDHKTSNKGRSSPLRRLLDPLLKYKGSQSTGVFQEPNGALHSTTSTTKPSKVPSPDRKPMRLPSRSLLRVTLNSGLPFFKLVVQSDSGEVLAAVVKKMPSSGKNDYGMIYEFYDVHEIKKKSINWIQSTKNKNGGLGFSIVGQMKISSSFLPKLHAKDSDHGFLRECVLYGVNREQVDKKEPDFLPDKEIAAIVLKSWTQTLNEGDLVYDKRLSNSSQERRFTKCVSGRKLDTKEDENCDSVVVILPGGVHGKPNKGAPSSLISRWRSGGSCDCGGWDVGCKLRVLANQYSKGDKFLDASVSGSTHDSVNLFAQDGSDRKSRPGFSLEAIGNGFYSLELDSSVSLLEAFATCVSFLTCHRFSEVLDKNIQHITTATADRTKNKMTTTTSNFGQKIPATYGSLLPTSPVGRI